MALQIVEYIDVKRCLVLDREKRKILKFGIRVSLYGFGGVSSFSRQVVVAGNGGKELGF